MTNSLIQLIPGLVALQTNVNKINCFTFWDNPEYKDFFKLSSNSILKFNYFVRSDVSEYSGKPTLNFSYVTYKDKQWFYKKSLPILSLKFTLNDRTNTMEVNNLYNYLPIKIGRLETAGDILTDYITNKLDEINISYCYGAAANFKNKSFLFFGLGKNFKTTLVRIITENGGYYIGEEFFALKNNLVYATIPRIHQFDFRDSHKKLLDIDLKKRKIDVSEYKCVVFLLYSDKDKIIEINHKESNKYFRIYKNIQNTYYYRFFQSKNFFLGKQTQRDDCYLKNTKARYFIAYFTDILNVHKFLKTL